MHLTNVTAIDWFEFTLQDSNLSLDLSCDVSQDLSNLQEHVLAAYSTAQNV